jgi:hypothetical protein
MEHVGIDVGAVGPHDRPDLGVDPDGAENGVVGKDRADPSSKVKSTT